MCLIISGCGDNVSDSDNPTNLPAPQNLKALSVDGSTIQYTWTAPVGLSDSTFVGYLIAWGTVQDSLPRTAVSYTLDSLPAGEVVFNIIARKTGNVLSPAAIIHWAPAARFSTPITLTEEYNQSEPLRICGLDVGGSQSDPEGLRLDFGSADIRARMDVYLYGGQGSVQDPLVLRSASILGAGWNSTLFSTESHASTTLNLPLAVFPSGLTFTESSVLVQENTIYYARVVGDQGGSNYVRIHVGVITGSGRSRSIRVTLSVQRSVGLEYAEARTLPGKTPYS